nr:MAG TPA: hypothetical protein [Caudoviricetes sp.]
MSSKTINHDIGRLLIRGSSFFIFVYQKKNTNILFI